MSLLDFQSNSLWLNLGWFAASAVIIWIAGTKLEHYVDGIAVQTGLGQAFLGMLLLASATSLPELATTVTATLSGNTSMAVHNLLGSIVMQTAFLAIADLAMGRKALSRESPRYALLIQGVGLVFLLAVALAGMSVSDQVTYERTLSNVTFGVWAVVLLASYVLMFHLTYRSQANPRWKPIHKKQSQEPKNQSSEDSAGEEDDWPGASLGWLIGSFVVASLFVLAAGWTTAQAGDALAKQTGLGSSFVGFALLGLATGLPEMSTTVAAARAGRMETAFSNIFGSNALMVALLVLIGLLAGSQTLMQSMSASTLFATSMGIALTCVYLWGLLEHEDRTVWRIGWDSMGVVCLTAVSLGVMYLLK